MFQILNSFSKHKKKYYYIQLLNIFFLSFLSVQYLTHTISEISTYSSSFVLITLFCLINLIVFGSALICVLGNTLQYNLNAFILMFFGLLFGFYDEMVKYATIDINYFAFLIFLILILVLPNIFARITLKKIRTEIFDNKEIE